MATAKKTGKQRGGRPTKYRPEYCEQAMLVAGRGFIDKDLARLFRVDLATIKRWKDQYPEFCAALQKGKAICDDEVEKALYQRATGYSHPDVHVGQNGRVIPIIKHYAPDVAACFIWLKNRRPDKWRDRQLIDYTGVVEHRIVLFRGDDNPDDGDRKPA